MPTEQASTDKINREEMARRLDWIITIHMLPVDGEEWPTNFRNLKSWHDCFDIKTPSVQEMTRNWVDWITGVTDEISDSHERMLDGR